MPRGPKGEKRPADVIGNAVHVMRIATGKLRTTYLKRPSLQGEFSERALTRNDRRRGPIGSVGNLLSEHVRRSRVNLLFGLDFCAAQVRIVIGSSPKKGEC